VYIGQTKRDLKTRVNEHRLAVNKPQNPRKKNYNHLAFHAQKENHTFDFENTTVIHFEPNLRKRLAAEAMAMVNFGEKAVSQASYKINDVWINTIQQESGTFFKERATLGPCVRKKITGRVNRPRQTKRKSLPLRNNAAPAPATHRYTLRPRK
jgi:hypothetical protein